MKTVRVPTLLATVLVLSLMASFDAGAEVGTAMDALPQRLDRLLSTYEQYGFSGAVLVSRDGRILLEQGYGLANRETGERNTADTLFDFASIAKTFTGAAVLALEDEGRLSVDDRLEEHLGAFSDERKSAATVHHLATHTAGLAHRSQSELDYSEERSRWIQSMKDAPFESVPGESYRYSNAGTSLLAALVEEVAGKPFEEIVRERLFVPAGLESTRFYPELERGAAGVALGYADESNVAAAPEYEGWTWGAKGSTGIVSTVGDIHAWFQAVHGGRVLPAEQTARAFDHEQTEAFGWHTETDDQGRTFIHKGGGLSAMQSQILAYPDQGVVIVWAHNNMARNWRRALNRGLTAVAFGEPHVAPPQIAAAPSSDPGLVGSWQTEGGTRIELVETDRRLGVGGNGFGLREGTLRSGADDTWVSFDVERVSSFVLSRSTEGELFVDLEPEGERMALVRAENPEPAYVALDEPTAEALDFGRQVSGWLLSGDVEQLWNSTAYRPLRGSDSRQGWAERSDFIAGRVGEEVGVIEEAWVLREGSWRYWRTLEAGSGMQVTLRFRVSADRKVLGYGINPRGSEPGFDEKRVIGGQGQDPPAQVPSSP